MSKFNSNREGKDPNQITVTGRLKEGKEGDLIIFTLRLGPFEVLCICNIPEEGKKEAPVYCHFKLRPKLNLSSNKEVESTE